MFFHYFSNPDANLSTAEPDLTEAGVGQRVAQCRRERKMTQLALSDRSRVAASAISRFESGRQRPSLDTLCRLAHTLDVSVDFLVGRTDAQLAHKAFGIELAQQAGMSAKVAVLELMRELTEVFDRAESFDWAEAKTE